MSGHPSVWKGYVGVFGILVFWILSVGHSEYIERRDGKERENKKYEENKQKDQKNSFSWRKMSKVFKLVLLCGESSCVYLLLFSLDKLDFPQRGTILVAGYSVVRASFWFYRTHDQHKGEKSELEKSTCGKYYLLEPVSIYTDIDGHTLFECIVVFTLQACLYSVLYLSFLGLFPEEEEEYAQCKFKAYEIPVIGGNPDPEEFFYALGSVTCTLMRPFMETFINGEYKPFWSRFDLREIDKKDQPTSLCIRWWLSFFANHVGPLAVLFTAPMVLKEVCNGMDFVKDATAVLFIHELDTLRTTPKPLEIPIEASMRNPPQMAASEMKPQDPNELLKRRKSVHDAENPA